MNVRTKYWHRTAQGRVVCDVCPRACSLRDGQRGFCFVRACEQGEIVLTTWGRSSGFCVDPIEKKPLNHFLPGTAVLSFGTAGCNLACAYCQNWDISKARETDVLADTATPERIARAAVDLGCDSVAFTYNDPVVFLEYAVDVAAACHAAGVRTVAVTAGYISDAPRRELFAAVDAANVDLKAFSEDFYRRITKGHLAPVLDTLRYLARETNVWLEITTLVVPGYNDSDTEIGQLADWVVRELGADVPLHLSAFHPDYRMRDVPPTPSATLRRARAVARRAGLRHVYTGNVYDPEGQSTRCHVCGLCLIERDGYSLRAWRLGDDGRCSRCGTPCPGVFRSRPGTWGARRQPVRLADLPAAS